MSTPSLLPDRTLLEIGWRCVCPKCKQGRLFNSRFSQDLKPACDHCGLDFSKSDIADGPAVFIIFILGVLLAPLALLMDYFFSPPLWVQGVFWTAVIVGLTLLMLKPLKAYVMALQYRHRPWD